MQRTWPCCKRLKIACCMFAVATWYCSTGQVTHATGISWHAGMRITAVHWQWCVSIKMDSQALTQCPMRDMQVLPRVPDRPHPGVLPHLGDPGGLHAGPAGPLPALSPAHPAGARGAGHLGLQQVRSLILRLVVRLAMAESRASGTSAGAQSHPATGRAPGYGRVKVA